MKQFISERSIPKQWAVLAVTGWLVLTLTSVSRADESRGGDPAVRENALGKFLGKTMKMATRAPFQREDSAQPSPVPAAPAPVYSKPYPSQNSGLAARLLDPQRKESPINTAMLFKIPLVQGQPITPKGAAE